jgi:flagellar biosynthesis chaperone FliJ
VCSSDLEIKGEKLRIITNKQMVMFISDIKELIKDKNKTIEDKKKEIEELVDDFYANNIQTINYSKNNRYVVMA